VLRHGASFFYGTTDAGTVAGMTANALSPHVFQLVTPAFLTVTPDFELNPKSWTV
jgi:hypothetical protein